MANFSKRDFAWSVAIVWWLTKQAFKFFVIALGLIQIAKWIGTVITLIMLAHACSSGC